MTNFFCIINKIKLSVSFLMGTRRLTFMKEYNLFSCVLVCEGVFGGPDTGTVRSGDEPDGV